MSWQNRNPMKRVPVPAEIFVNWIQTFEDRCSLQWIRLCTSNELVDEASVSGIFMFLHHAVDWFQSLRQVSEGEHPLVPFDLEVTDMLALSQTQGFRYPNECNGRQASPIRAIRYLTAKRAF